LCRWCRNTAAGTTGTLPLLPFELLFLSYHFTEYFLSLFIHFLARILF
jgi:hypothetical protein